MTHTDYTVRYVTTTAKGRLVTKTGTFADADARAAFLDQLDEAGLLHEVLAFSDPQ